MQKELHAISGWNESVEPKMHIFCEFLLDQRKESSVNGSQDLMCGHIWRPLQR